MTIGWQEIADEIIKSLFLKDNEAIVGDRLLTAEENAIELDEIRRYIKTLRLNKASSSDEIKKYIRKPLLYNGTVSEIINDCFQREYFSMHLLCT